MRVGVRVGERVGARVGERATSVGKPPRERRTSPPLLRGDGDTTPASPLSTLTVKTS